MAWKYVMFKNQLRHIPIIFPSVLVHADVVNQVKTMPGLEQAELVSAGFVYLTGTIDGKPSSSLNLGPQGIDEMVINNMNYLNGIIREE